MKFVIKTEPKPNMEISSVYCCYKAKRELVQVWVADFRHRLDAEDFLAAQAIK